MKRNMSYVVYFQVGLVTVIALILNTNITHFCLFNPKFSLHGAQHTQMCGLNLIKVRKPLEYLLCFLVGQLYRVIIILLLEN